jgi:hypothetical protein
VSGRRNFLLALKERLEKMTTSNGYPFSVKKVFLNDLKRLSIDIPAMECPSIEIIQDNELFEHKHQTLDVSSSIFLRLVHNSKATDEDMEVFKSMVIRCLYKDSPLEGLGTPLSPLLEREGKFTNTSLSLKECVSDLGMIEANRVYALSLVARYIVSIHNF